MKIPVITVDGPGSSGKGTVSALVAKALGWHLLDSGLLYRVLAFAAEQNHISWEDEAALATLAQHLNIQGGGGHILLEGTDVTHVIRGERYGSGASKIGAFPQVRRALVDQQRAFRQMPGLVADGRDMGTVIFPDANPKIFLLASPRERAIRRCCQLQARGIPADVDQIYAELCERDTRDKMRQVAPLKPAADAVCIETDGVAVEDIVVRILKLVV